MNSSRENPLPIAVLGAGLTGLSAAHHLSRAGRKVVVFEASPFPGGVIRSDRTADGWLVESGPNSLQETPAVAALLRELGLESARQAAAPAAKNRYILRDGKLRPLPLSPPVPSSPRMPSSPPIAVPAVPALPAVDPPLPAVDPPRPPSGIPPFPPLAFPLEPPVEDAPPPAADPPAAEPAPPEVPPEPSDVLEGVRVAITPRNQRRECKRRCPIPGELTSEAARERHVPSRSGSSENRPS